MVKPNEQIGPYTLVRQLGKGGFGVVWLAERRSKLATTEVAVKLILDDDPDIDAITKESQLWVQAGGHPNVLSIIEANVYDNQVVIVSEYAPDGSLQEWLKDKKEIPLLDVVNLTLGILSGLEHLHSRRIIHRDLKPANILLSKGVPRLADFGLARVMKSSANSGSVAGTPAYMAPEAFDGKRCLQSDIWSVGVILYQLLSNRLPFPQSDMTALIGAIIGREPQLMADNIPVSLQKIVYRALQKNIAQRYESTIEMKLDLQKALKQLEIDNIYSLENTTKQFSDIAFVSTEKIEGNVIVNKNTAKNQLNTNSATEGELVSIPRNQRVPKTNKVIPSAKMYSNTLPETQNNKWKTYTVVMLCALVVPIGSLAYFKSKEKVDPFASNNKNVAIDKTSSPIIEITPEKQTQELQPTTISTNSNYKLTSNNTLEEADWEKLRKSTNPKDYEKFIKKYPNGQNTFIAKTVLKQLEEGKSNVLNNTQANQSQTNQPQANQSQANQSEPKKVNTDLGSVGVMKASNGNESEVTGTNLRTGITENSYSTNQQSQNIKNPPLSPNLSNFNISGAWRQRGGVCRDGVFYFTQNGNLVNVESNEECRGMGRVSLQKSNLRLNDNVLEYKTTVLGKNIQVTIYFDRDGRHAKKLSQVIGGIGQDSADLEKQ